MSQIHFQPIAGRTVEIIDSVMAAEEFVALPELQFAMRLVVEELVSNVVNYSTSDLICIDIERQEKMLRLVMTDAGIPFNPLERETPDTTLDANERQIGGLGIFLVRELMSRVTYTYANNTNILTLEKDLE